MMMFQTLARVMRAPGDTLTVRCPGCGHWAVWSRREAFERLGPDATPHRSRRRLACGVCGLRGGAVLEI
jgi:hypothetical protein